MSKRRSAPFLEISTVDALYDRIITELPQESVDRIAEQGLKLYLIKHLRSESVLPCTDFQAFEQAVDKFQAHVEMFVEVKRIGFQEARKMTSVAALMELKEGDIRLELRGTKGSSVYSKKHEKAGQEQKRFELNPIPLHEDEKASIPSLFMQKRQQWENDSVCYFNESDIQHIVHLLLQDAVLTCNALLRKTGTPIKLQYRLEASIWSEKPDHVVIFDGRSSAPLVSIEVKKPVHKKDLDTFDRVRGQACDYLYVSKLQGHSCPIHLTTTIDESYVAWLPDNEFVQNYNGASEHGMGNFWKQLSDSVRSDGGTNALTQSPLRVERAPSTAPTPPNDLFLATEIKRTICTSQSFKGHQLFQVMVNVILCGLHGSSRSPSVPQLCIGDRVTKTALELTARSYKWVELDAVVQGPLRGANRDRLNNIGQKLAAIMGYSRTMYAVGVVGVGSTSKAFRVLTSNGYEGVAKVYVKKHDDHLKFELDKKIFEANARSSVSRELEVFRNTYPEMPVSKVVVHGHESLLMPFFSPIRIDHANYEDSIKEQLRLVRDGRSSLCYKEEDMRWRHIGLYGNEVRVFDFNNMATIEKAKVESQARIHWDTIIARVPPEEAPQEHIRV